MNPDGPATDIESRWRTYLGGAAFSIPALSILAFSCVFLFPKLEAIWCDAGLGASSAITAVHVAYFVTQHVVLIAAVVIALVVLLEWRSRRWPRYRRVSVGVTAFLANTMILVFMAAMLVTAMIAASALREMK